MRSRTLKFTNSVGVARTCRASAALAVSMQCCSRAWTASTSGVDGAAVFGLAAWATASWVITAPAPPPVLGSAGRAAASPCCGGGACCGADGVASAVAALVAFLRDARFFGAAASAAAAETSPSAGAGAVAVVASIAGSVSDGSVFFVV